MERPTATPDVKLDSAIKSALNNGAYIITAPYYFRKERNLLRSQYFGHWKADFTLRSRTSRRSTVDES